MKLIEGKAIYLDKENIDLSFGEFGKILVIENPTKTQFDALYTITKDIRETKVADYSSFIDDVQADIFFFNESSTFFI